jgi:hypothetical protein
LTISAGADLQSLSSTESSSFSSNFNNQDTLKERQILYNGILFKNKFLRIDGDPYLFKNYFLPGTVSLNGRKFTNLKIRYDIFTDELMIPINLSDILQLNKEMVDSFTINFENKVYKFIKFPEDTLKKFGGYLNELYKVKSALYVKYKKSISTNITDKSDGEFMQIQKIYFVKDDIIYPITSLHNLLKIINKDEMQIKTFIRENKLRVSSKMPESFIPVIRYYDSLSQ